MNAPCLTCPWRRSSVVGGSEIPNFSIELMRGLANTVGEGDDFRTIMACHGSACGAEIACAGYIAVEGYTNLNVRILASYGKIPITDIIDACADIELWPSFGEMLAAYEEAQ